MNPAYLSVFANHVWQSTVIAGIAALLTLLLRRNRARVRHWVWVAASWKFVVPFSVLLSLGGHFPWRTAPRAAQANWSTVIETVGRPFAAPVVSAPRPPETVRIGGSLEPAVWVVWACGFVVISAGWWFRWRHLRAAVRMGSPVELDVPIRAVSSPTLVEPGVFGVFRPILMLPEGIVDRLTAAQLKGVIAHELCHVRYRDNLVAAVQMTIETLFWFHPLVWWMGRRMVEERERACDEEVLRQGCEPRVYAEGILTICKLYTESRLACVSGVSGWNLNRRIEAIMRRRASARLDFGRKAALALAGIAVVAAPFGIGMMNAPMIEAQSAASRFEVVSIKPTSQQGSDIQGLGNVRMLPGGHLLAEKALLRYFIQNAYGLKPWQIAGGPAWIDSAHYDIDAKAGGDPNHGQMRAMMQALLEERFQLKAHHETKQLPVYAVTVAKSGSKLPEPKEGSCSAPDPTGAGFPPPPGQLIPCGRILVTMSPSGAQMRGGKVSMADLISILSNVLGRTVVDKTGNQRTFDVHLEFTPDEALGGLPTPPPGAPGPGGSTTSAAMPDTRGNIFAAMQEQLGLKVEPAKGPVDILVIDTVERPSAN